MKKVKLLIVILIASASCNLNAQSSQIAASSYKQIFRIGGEWGKWPSYWTSYESEGRSNPVFRITTISEGNSGDIYRLQMFIGGNVEADFYVKYDPEQSKKIRDQWNNKYINCYADPNGDYVFTQEVSLESLARDNSAWVSNESSSLYLMVYSEDLCVVVR